MDKFSGLLGVGKNHLTYLHYLLIIVLDPLVRWQVFSYFITVGIVLVVAR